MFESKYESVDSKHKAAIMQASGMGNPVEYYPYCSCGWRGIVIDSFPAEQTCFYPSLEPLIEQYGANQVVRKPNESSGTIKDAIKQVLIHINYDTKFDEKTTLNSFNKIFEKYTQCINEGKFEQSLVLINELKKAHMKVLDMQQNIDIFENYQLNIPEFKPEIYKEVQRIINDHRENKDKNR